MSKSRTLPAWAGRGLEKKALSRVDRTSHFQVWAHLEGKAREIGGLDGTKVTTRCRGRREYDYTDWNFASRRMREALAGRAH